MVSGEPAGHLLRRFLSRIFCDLKLEDRRLDKTRNRQWLRWLHWIGYLTIALIVIKVASIALVAGRGWLHEREKPSKAMEQSRTSETRLLPTDDIRRDNAIELLGAMTPLTDLRGDGFRFVAMPSFSRKSYGVVIYLRRPDARQANGILTIFGASGSEKIQHRNFSIPVANYRTLTAKIDKLTDGWQGEENICLDGTPAAFERVRATRITSGVGSCSNNYNQLKSFIHESVRRFASEKDLPADNNWESI